MEKLIQVVVVLIFAATPLSKAQTSNGIINYKLKHIDHDV